jgi:hypothetical protein
MARAGYNAGPIMSMIRLVTTACALGSTVAVLALAGCSHPARMLQERPDGGTVVYPVSDDRDVLASAGRTDAIKMIEEKCPHGYRVTKQGETLRINPQIDRAWRGQIASERQWGIEFVCKE